MNEELSLFYEDATDQLQIMESALLDAKDGTNDNEKISEIFRAMHTIKGTAGMFEFTDIVSFTHIAENILDDVRSEKIQLDASLASLFMQVKDSTENMVECCVKELSLPDELNTTIDELKTKLSKFMIDTGETNDIEKINITESINTSENKDDDIWHISLRFEKDFFTSGMDVISIFRFFNKLGEVLLNIPIINNIPLLEDIDCLTTYIGFEVDFQSNCTKDEIIEIFEFVEDDVILSVFKHSDKESLIKLIDLNGSDLKDVLIQAGSFQREDFSTTETNTVSKENIIQSDLKENTENKQKEQSSTPKKEVAVTNKQKTSSLRVDSSKVDLLINKMGEMVIQNAKLTQLAELNNDDDLEEVSSGITVLLEEVREAVMNIRMVQVKDSFVKFRRIVNDTAKKLGKDIDFIIEGGETELDKSVVEKLSDPLVHMLRNSIDHGIEMPEVRKSKNKNEKGTVYLRAYPDSGGIIIEIEDDGAGINKDVVLRKAIEKGIASTDSHLNDKEIYKLIFAAGLSTANEVSDISGRGVGMDVVKRNIEDLRGIIDVDSAFDKGSKITIRLPLTLAIIDGFLVQAGHTKYIIPLDLISECMELEQDYHDVVQGSSTINVRGDVLPLLDVIEFFDEEKIENIRKNVVVVKYGNYKVGLLIDELYGEQQTVIKPLGDIFEHVPGVSGGSILGTGEVALIFDITRLLEYKIKQGV
mgnify:CR=1 FL=1